MQFEGRHGWRPVRHVAEVTLPDVKNADGHNSDAGIVTELSNCDHVENNLGEPRARSR